MSGPSQRRNRFGVLAHKPEENSGRLDQINRPAQWAEQLWFPTRQAQLDSAMGHLINGYVVQLNGAEK